MAEFVLNTKYRTTHGEGDLIVKCVAFSEGKKPILEVVDSPNSPTQYKGDLFYCSSNDTKGWTEIKEPQTITKYAVAYRSSYKSSVSMFSYLLDSEKEALEYIKSYGYILVAIIPVTWTEEV